MNSMVAGSSWGAVSQRQVLSEESRMNVLEKHSPFVSAQPCGMLLCGTPRV